ncbi:MAG TPA: haloalkane dehalogenase [Candidatus Dormibacteraeota bacterium]|nr:haloalkane dehalogenase [Candidatus Dormibacteraeota bacterium]
METYRTPDERFEGLPGFDFEPHYIEQDGLRLHYLDEGSGDPLVLFHGEPTWSYLYRKMIPPLVAAGHRCVAPDYFGFGRSDKPQQQSWYTYDRHVASMKRLVEELDLRNATPVVQDWGGPIGLRVATEMDDRFARLVILNTGLWRGQNKMSEAWWAFHDFVERVKPDLPIGLLVSRVCAIEPAPEVVAAYEAPFPEPDSKWGAVAFPLLVPTSPASPGAAEEIELNRRLEEWKKPALVAFSDSDPMFTTRTGERFAERIPGAGPLVVIEGAAHFLQEDRGEEIAGHIVEFLKTS